MLQAFFASVRRPGRRARHRLPGRPAEAASSWRRESGVTYPLVADPRRRARPAPAPFPSCAGCRSSRSSPPTARSSTARPARSTPSTSSSSSSSEHLGTRRCDGPRPRPRSARLAASRCATAPPSITVARPDPLHAARGRRRPRRGAVLMLFGEGAGGPDLLLTERAHDMRSHPGQVSFPGGSIDAGETAARGGAARGRGGDRPRPRGRRGLRRAPRAVAAAEQLRGHPGARLVARAQPRSASSTPTRCTRSTGCRSPSWSTPTHRISVRHPQRAGSARASCIGDDKDVILWGFTAGIVARLFDYLGWTAPVGRAGA